MIKTKELFNEAISLPVEIRTQLIEKLLLSLNPSQKEIDKLWAKEAEKRVEEIRTGKVKTISGEKAFKKILHRLSR
jgi:putative addiction module component (TIGR02574 family)